MVVIKPNASGKRDARKKKTTVAERVNLDAATTAMFLKKPTTEMKLPSLGYFFEGCEYVFLDSEAKARRPHVSHVMLRRLRISAHVNDDTLA
jgi:hypothetical protein